MGVYISEVGCEYNVGDKVRIVDEPMHDMVFGWNGKMTELCGSVGTIRAIEWVSHRNAYAFYFEEFTWCWDHTCFVPIDYTPDEDFEVEEGEFLKLLGF